MAEAPMQEHRNAGERMVLVAGDEIGADILLANVEFGLAARAASAARAVPCR